MFKITQCKNVEGVRRKFSYYIKKWHKNDDRLILSLSFDGKQINSEWMELDEYLNTHEYV